MVGRRIAVAGLGVVGLLVVAACGTPDGSGVAARGAEPGNALVLASQPAGPPVGLAEVAPAASDEAPAASVPHEPLHWMAVNMPQATGSTLAVAGEPAEQQDSKGNEIIVRGRVTGWF